MVVPITTFYSFLVLQTTKTKFLVGISVVPITFFGSYMIIPLQIQTKLLVRIDVKDDIIMAPIATSDFVAL